MSTLSLPERFTLALHRLDYKRHATIDEVLGLRIFTLDLSPLRLRFSDKSPFIEITRRELTSRVPEEICATVRDVMRQQSLQDRIPIILLEGESAVLRRLANQPPLCGIRAAVKR